MNDLEPVAGKAEALDLLEDVISKLEDTHRAQWALRSARRLRRWISEETA